MSGGHAVPIRHIGVATALTAAVCVIELAGGFAAHSLALISDAAHVFMDVVALAIGWIALVQSRRPATPQRTYGFVRLEVLAALGNGGLLFAVTVLVAIEAAHRFAHPQLPHGRLMFTVAVAGLIINLLIAFLLRQQRSNMNVRAALMHVIGDAISAFAVVVGGVAISLTGAAWIDPLLSLLVCAIIVRGVIGIVREAAEILLESAPAHAGPQAVRERVLRIDGVVDIHDLHVWTLGTDSFALSAHVLLADARISEATKILRAIEDALRAAYGITHTTLQFECVACAADDRIVCTQVDAPGAMG